MEDPLFEAQMMRALGYAPYGGADVGEVLATAAQIRATDLSLWLREWTALAMRVYAEAERSHAAGDRVGACRGYLSASNYFRTSWLFELRPPVSELLSWGHLREVDAFRRGAALLPTPPRLVQIPYDGTTLPGYFFAVDDRPRRTLILTNGYDGTAEELYFTNGAAAIERGWNVLAFDGPGQGSALIDQGLPFRPDWESVATPVVDFARTLPEVDPAQIVLMGLSLGGYFAPRGATGEHRLAACVSDCGPYDLMSVVASKLPRPLAGQVPDGNPVVLNLVDRLVRLVMRMGMGGLSVGMPTAGWAMRRNMLVHDLDSPLAYFRMATDYSLVGLEHLIECPTLVCAAEGDDLSAHAPRLFEALQCRKELIEFTRAEGAAEHCEGGARVLFHQRVFAWLDEVLAPADWPGPQDD